MAQHYDVAVVGADVSQLLAALMLARMGRRVLIIEHHRVHPALLETPCYALGDMSCISRIHDELGITPPPTLRNISPQVLQVLLPKHRLALGGGREGLARELKLAFPEASLQIDDVLQLVAQQDRIICQFLLRAPSLPPETLAERFALWRCARAVAHLVPAPSTGNIHPFWQTLGLPHEGLQRFLRGSLALLQDGSQAQPSPFAAVHLLSQALMGHGSDAPNRGALTELLLETVRRAGIEVRQGVHVKKVVLSGRRAERLELVQERQEVRAEHYLFGSTDILSALWADAETGLAPQEAKIDRQIAASGCWLQRQWQVPTRLVNVALGRLAWHLDGRSEGRGPDGLSDEPFVLQRLDQPSQQTTQLTLTAPVMHAETQNGGDVTGALWAQQAWQRMVPRLRRTLPHLPQDAAGLGPLRALRPGPMALPEAAFLGLTGRSRKSRLRNVVCCGRDVVPGLGLEGEYLAASGCVALLKKRAGWR